MKTKTWQRMRWSFEGLNPSVWGRHPSAVWRCCNRKSVPSLGSAAGDDGCCYCCCDGCCGDGCGCSDVFVSGCADCDEGGDGDHYDVPRQNRMVQGTVRMRK